MRRSAIVVHGLQVAFIMGGRRFIE